MQCARDSLHQCVGSVPHLQNRTCLCGLPGPAFAGAFLNHVHGPLLSGLQHSGHYQQLGMWCLGIFPPTAHVQVKRSYIWLYGAAQLRPLRCCCCCMISNVCKCTISLCGWMGECVCVCVVCCVCDPLVSCTWRRVALPADLHLQATLLRGAFLVVHGVP